jgi:cytochrome c
MMLPLRLGLAMALCLGWQTARAAGGDAVRGLALYQAKCAACHSIDYNGVGPAHKNLFGRKAGSAPDYAYSPALAASTIRWNDATLERWLRNPEQLVPGQKMGFQVNSARERADLIAYLKQVAAQP